MITKAIIESCYNDNLLAYQSAERIIKTLITDMITGGGRGEALRVQMPVESRIKTIKSIIKKIQTRKFRSYEEVKDIVGIKIIVNNLSDVRGMLSLLYENLLAGRAHEAENMIERPRENGYRAIHINLDYDVEQKHRVLTVPVEIQIKTISQELWSTLTHSDIYKPGGNEIPAIIRSFTKTLGTILSVVDEQAQEIRTFLEQKITVTKELSMDPDDRIDREIIARIIKNEMNHEIDEEEYLEIITSLDANNVCTIDLIRKLLKSQPISTVINDIFTDTLKRRANPVEYLKYGSFLLFDALKGEPLDSGGITRIIYSDYDITDDHCSICLRRLAGYETAFSASHYGGPGTICENCLENNFERCHSCRNGFVAEAGTLCRNCAGQGSVDGAESDRTGSAPTP